MILHIKPFSINKAWVWTNPKYGKPRRVKSDKYKQWRIDCINLLPNISKQFNKDTKIELYIKFGFSSAACDIDNPLKSLIDALQDKYKGFNDKMIYRLVVDREQVKKGKEFIELNIYDYDPTTI